MRGLRVLLLVACVAGAGFVMSGCTTTREENGVIIEKSSWWNIFSEAEPAPEADGDRSDLPS